MKQTNKMKLERKISKAVALVAQKIKLPTFSATAESIAERDKLVADAKQITAIASLADQTKAAAVVVNLRLKIKSVKSKRKQLCKTLDVAKSSLMTIEKDWCGPIEAEVDRIEREANKFQDAEEKRAAEAEALRLSELRLLEQQRILNEQKLAATTAPKQVAKIEAKLEATEEQFQAALRVPEITSELAKGQMRRSVLNYKIVDAKAAYAANPTLFELSPRASVIKAVCIPADDKNEANPEVTLYPGIACWWTKETTFSTR